MRYKITTIILLLCLTLSLVLIFTGNAEKYTSTDYWQRYPELERVFKNSQYVSKNPEGWAPDEVVYAYAGGAFIQGVNPVLVLPEVSTLGKYIIGVSAILFNNENILIMIVMGIAAIIAMVILGHQIFQNWTLALIPPLLLSLEPLFRNQFKYVPHMDIAQMCFLLWSFVTFNLARSTTKPHWWLSTATFIGLFISTKFYVSGSTIVAAMVLVLLVYREWRNLAVFVLTLPLSIIILLLTYARAFAFGYSPRSFLGIQRWIFEYHTGKVDKTLSVWPLIYLNQWYVWWGDQPILQESQWRFTWPLTVTTSLLGAIGWLSRKIHVHPHSQILFAFTLTYLAFLSLGQTTARYLVILQPVLYLLTVYLAVQIWSWFKTKHSNDT